jgi:N-acetylglutamate synthase-like GNAT family acetyltransferase
VIDKLNNLKNNLQKLGFKKESLDVINIIKKYNINKFADSRGNMMRLLKLTEEEANYFHNLSPSKAFNLAKWFLEWRSSNGSNKPFLEQISDFKESISFSGDNDFIYDNIYHSLLDSLIEDDSFYQSVKNKSLNDIVYSKDNKSSPFELYILRKYHPGEEIFKDRNYTWYDVGPECAIVSSFLKNCGSIGELGPEGEYGDYASFSMFALKNKDNKPLLIITVGNAYIESLGQTHPVIVNISASANRLPNDPILLDYLFNFAKKNNYKFAKLYFNDEDQTKKINQTPGLNINILRENGFKIYKAYIGDLDYSEDFDKEAKYIEDLVKTAEDCNCNIIHYDEEYSFQELEEEYNANDIESQVLKLFKNSGIRMMYKDEYYSFCIASSGKILGCLVYHLNEYLDEYPVYYFSIVTDPQCNRRGIATKLILDFVNTHKNHSIIKSETFNRDLDSLLKRMGFIEYSDQINNDIQSIKFHVLLPEEIKDIYNDK